MSADAEASLNGLDNKKLDGLAFRIEVCDLFEKVRKAPDGLERIRLRSDETAKKLVEELGPIARYVQTCYDPGLRVQVRWVKGSQPYDAILYYPAEAVQKEQYPEEIFLEATTAVHESDYLSPGGASNKSWFIWAQCHSSRQKKSRCNLAAVRVLQQ